MGGPVAQGAGSLGSRGGLSVPEARCARISWAHAGTMRTSGLGNHTRRSPLSRCCRGTRCSRLGHRATRLAHPVQPSGHPSICRSRLRFGCTQPLPAARSDTLLPALPKRLLAVAPTWFDARCGGRTWCYLVELKRRKSGLAAIRLTLAAGGRAHHQEPAMTLSGAKGKGCGLQAAACVETTRWVVSRRVVSTACAGAGDGWHVCPK